MHSLHSDLPYAHNDPSSVLRTKGERPASSVEAFATAFLAAQCVVSMRSRVGWMWRFREITKDLSAEHMEVVDSYIQPILETAINKKNREKGVWEKEAMDNEDDNETLLDHLVKQTDGETHCAAGANNHGGRIAR